MQTDKAIEKLAEVAPIATEAINKLTKDKDFVKFMTTYKSGISNRLFMINIIPILFKNCKDEIYKCMSIFTDIPEEEIKKQSFRKTVDQIKKLLQDEDIAYFFQSLSEKDTETKENTDSPQE